MKKANLLSLVILAQALLFLVMHSFGIIGITTIGICGFAAMVSWFLLFGITSYCFIGDNRKAMRFAGVATAVLFVIESITELFLVQSLYNFSQEAGYIMYGVESVLAFVIVVVVACRIARIKPTLLWIRILLMIAVFAAYVAAAFYVVKTLPEYYMGSLFDAFVGPATMPRYDAMIKIHALYYALEGVCLTLFCVKKEETWCDRS